MKTLNGIIQGIEYFESPNCNERPEEISIDLIVIHAISLPPKNYNTALIKDLFLNKLDAGEDPYLASIKHLKVSSHFLVTRAGQLIQFVPIHLRAWHAGISSFQGRENCNDFSIGIELEGCEEEEFTDVQYETLSELVRFLKDEHLIIESNIVGHSTIAPGRKTDPGPNFKWDLLKSSI
jgi:AmpD protein